MQRRVVRHADCDVIPLFREIDPAVGNRQVDRQFRIAGKKLRQCRRNVQCAECYRGAHAQYAARLRIEAGDEFFRLYGFVEHAVAMIGDGSTDFRQAEMPGGAVEEARAEVLFQLCHGFAHHRARCRQAPRCFREAAGIHHARIDRHQVEIGHAVLCGKRFV